jgi:hypothetical protein
MLCKAENRDPAHCLKEGRRVTRCATDLYALPVSFLDNPYEWVLLPHSPFTSVVSARCAKTVCNNSRRIGTAWK